VYESWIRAVVLHPSAQHHRVHISHESIKAKDCNVLFRNFRETECIEIGVWDLVYKKIRLKLSF
jgi:hypothetical protein